MSECSASDSAASSRLCSAPVPVAEQRRAARLGDVDEHALLVTRVPLHGLDEVGHEVVPAAELGVDVGPRVRHQRGLRREPVVRDGGEEEDATTTAKPTQIMFIRGFICGSSRGHIS